MTTTEALMTIDWGLQILAATGADVAGDHATLTLKKILVTRRN